MQIENNILKTDVEIAFLLRSLYLKSLENITENYIFEISHIGLLNSIFEENKIQDGIKNKILNCIRSKSIDEFDMICKNEQIDENIINKLKVFMKNFRSILWNFGSCIPCYGYDGWNGNNPWWHQTWAWFTPYNRS